MARHRGRVQLEQSNMRVHLNMAKMAKVEFSSATKVERQQLFKKAWAEVREEKKHRVDLPRYTKVKATNEIDLAIVQEN